MNEQTLPDRIRDIADLDLGTLTTGLSRTECRTELHEIATAVAKLDQELTETADKLSSCWLFLDELARSDEYITSRMAEEVLRKQQAPGWRMQT